MAERVLGFVRESSDAVTVRDIADGLSLSVSFVQGLAKKLFDQGLLIRVGGRHGGYSYSVADGTRALGISTRQAILQVLKEGPATSDEIMDKYKFSVCYSTINNHLKILEREGRVFCEWVGFPRPKRPRKLYTIIPDSGKESKETQSDRKFWAPIDRQIEKAQIERAKGKGRD